jgi:hypothetical protein
LCTLHTAFRNLPLLKIGNTKTPCPLFVAVNIDLERVHGEIAVLDGVWLEAKRLAGLHQLWRTEATQIVSCSQVVLVELSLLASLPTPLKTKQVH